MLLWHLKLYQFSAFPQKDHKCFMVDMPEENVLHDGNKLNLVAISFVSCQGERLELTEH